MKEDRFNEKVSAGYQSKIFENAAWDDVSQMKVKDLFLNKSILFLFLPSSNRTLIKRHQSQLLLLVLHRKVL
jgi:hypothetical protein